MNPKVRRIIFILFIISAIATVVTYFITNKDIISTWIAGGVAGMFYIMYRFAK